MDGLADASSDEDIKAVLAELLEDEAPARPSIDSDVGPLSAVRFALAAPSAIRRWSHGEVTKSETLNYRTLKPERDGLFCARIFGPITDWECLCGKYKRVKNRGVVCDKCGVIVDLARVRRERFGHIELAAPIVHPWFHLGSHSVLASLLAMSQEQIHDLVMHRQWVLVREGEAARISNQASPIVLDDSQARDLSRLTRGKFVVKTGAGAISYLLDSLDLQRAALSLRAAMRSTKNKDKLATIQRRHRFIDQFSRSRSSPSWIVLEVLPVLPPELRPLVPLDRGRFATSDLNELYREVINRNNRLRGLIKLKAPDVIIRNEIVQLQLRVDALFDNGRASRKVVGVNRRRLQSLSDSVHGRAGRIRANLIGKRVDYSGRAVAVPDPRLPPTSCAVPIAIAVELLRPFIFNSLELAGDATTVKQASEMVFRQHPAAREALERVVANGHYVLIQCHPTKDQHSIRCFRMELTADRAIHLPPAAWDIVSQREFENVVQIHLVLSSAARMEAQSIQRAGLGFSFIDGRLRATERTRTAAVDIPDRPNESAGDIATFFTRSRQARQDELNRIRAARKIHALRRQLVSCLATLTLEQADCLTPDTLCLPAPFVRRLTRSNPDLLNGRSASNTNRWTKVRSPLSCRSDEAVCASCYGVTPEMGGDLVNSKLLGVRTAFALTSPLTALVANYAPDERFRVHGQTWFRGPYPSATVLLHGVERLVKLLCYVLPPNKEADLTPADGHVTKIATHLFRTDITIATVDDQTCEVHLPRSRRSTVTLGQRVRRGQRLCGGVTSLAALLKVHGRERAACTFILRALSCYRMLGVDLDPRHLEVLAKILFGYVRVLDPGDTNLERLAIVPRAQAWREAKRVNAVSGKPIQSIQMFVPVPSVLALSPGDVLARMGHGDARSAVLTAAIAGLEDRLKNPLANAISGSLVC